MINKNTLTIAPLWVSPTVKEVNIIISEILEIYNITDHQIPELIGVSARTIRRWKNKHEIDPDVKSNIPYSEWCKLVLLARNIIIFGNVIKCNVSEIPPHLITNFKNFKGGCSNELTKFIGKKSITRLTRIQIAKIFKISAAYLGRAIAENKVTFSTIALMLVLCGIDKNKLFYLDKQIKNKKNHTL